MKLLLLSLTLIPLVGACGGGGGSPHGDLALVFTDAPFCYEIVRTATVEVDRLAIDAGPLDPTGPARVIYSGAPKEIELTALRNGKVLHLLDAHLPLGTYARLHMHLAGARLELTDGQVYSSHDGSLVLPVQSEQGLDLPLLTPVTFVGDDSIRLLIDFDLTRCFLPQGSADPLLATSYQLDPILHLIRPGGTGEIRGVVTHDDGEGGELPVKDATVYILAAGSEGVGFAFASTSTDSDGSFVQLGLPPGAYDVRVYKSGVESLQAGSVVSAGDYTIVDLTLP